MHCNGNGRKSAARRRYEFWLEIIGKEDRESVLDSLRARKMLSEDGFNHMADRIEKKLRQDFPSIPKEAFD